MSNYTTENLVPVLNPGIGVPAIRIGDQVFTMVAGGGTDFYKCASVDTVNSTWTGYKAVLSGGVYSFEATITSGLHYTSVQPEVNLVYSEDALIRAILYTGLPQNGLVFYAPLSASAATAVTGQTLTAYSGNPSFTTYKGIPCAYFDGGDVIRAGTTDIPYSTSPISFSFWFNIASNPYSDTGIISLGKNYDGCLMAPLSNQNGLGLSGHGPGYGMDNIAYITYNGTWHHIVAIFDTGSGGSRPGYIYVDGNLSASGTFYYNYFPDDPEFYIGSYWGDEVHLDNLTGYLAAVRIYNRKLSAQEITLLAQEFTPTA